MGNGKWEMEDRKVHVSADSRQRYENGKCFEF
jgi:hypothetical protein